MVIFIEKINFNFLINLFYLLFIKKKKINLILFHVSNNFTFIILKFSLLFSNIKIKRFIFYHRWEKISKQECLESKLFTKSLMSFRSKLLSEDINFKKLSNIAKDSNILNLDYILKSIFSIHYQDYSALSYNTVTHRIFIILNLEHFNKLNSYKIIYLYHPIAWNETILKNYESSKIDFYKLKNFFPDYSSSKYYVFARRIIISFTKNLIRFFKSQIKNNNSSSKKNNNTLIKLAYEQVGELNFKKDYLNSDLFFYHYSKFPSKNLAIEYQDNREKKEILNFSMYPYKKDIFYDSYFTFTSKIKNKIKDINYSENQEIIKLTTEYQKEFFYWNNFFKKHNIKIFLAWNKYYNRHILIKNAINNFGGIFALWERSFDSYACPILLNVSDIVFRCGSWSFEYDKLIGSKFNYGVKVGTLRDYATNQANIKSKEIRNSLHKAGAKKIIAFFDQNSSDNFNEHPGQQEGYKHILNLVLENPELGLVIKPKKPKTLSDRLGIELVELLEQVKKTGRCYLFDSFGKFQSNVPIIMAAKCADIGIHSNLYAGTAAIECALEGKPTLLVDKEGYINNKLYVLEKNKVIFTNWADTIMALKELVKTNKKIDGLGDWGLFLNEIDPFRDGKGAYRMGTYLHNLIKGFENGLKKDDVLLHAAEIYSKKWGKDKIIFNNKPLFN